MPASSGSGWSRSPSASADNVDRHDRAPARDRGLPSVPRSAGAALPARHARAVGRAARPGASAPWRDRARCRYEPQPKTYVVNLVPAVAAVGRPQGRASAPRPHAAGAAAHVPRRRHRRTTRAGAAAPHERGEARADDQERRRRICRRAKRAASVGATRAADAGRVLAREHEPARSQPDAATGDGAAARRQGAAGRRAAARGHEPAARGASPRPAGSVDARSSVSAARRRRRSARPEARPRDGRGDAERLGLSVRVVHPGDPSEDPGAVGGTRRSMAGSPR